MADILERAGAPEALRRRAQADLVPRRAHPQFHLHHGRDGARPVRPPAGSGPGDGARSSRSHLLAGGHTLYLCAPAHDQRRLAATSRRSPRQCWRTRSPGHEVGSAARSAAARRPGRGGAHRPPGRARRARRHLRVTRDPDRDRVAGPGAGPRPLRRPGADGAQQPPGQAVPARHRRPRHPRVRQPAHRRRRGRTPLGDAGPRGRALDDVVDGPRAGCSPRGPPLPAPGPRRAGLRLVAAGAAAAAALVGAREARCEAGPAGRYDGRLRRSVTTYG